jgi:glycosyltransferase involved in cell wall biosynthesis
MGGAQYQGKAIYEHLSAMPDVDVHFIGRRIRAESLSDTHIHDAGRGRPIAGSFLADTPRFIATLRTLQPNVIYQRVACTYTGLAALYSRYAGARLVWHVAHDSDVEPTTVARKTPSSIIRHLDDRLIEFGIRHANTIIVQTHHQSVLLKKNFGLAPTAVIPNFHPAPTSRRDKDAHPVLIAWVANIKPFKRPELFVRLARDFAGRDNVKFVMVGAPPLADPAWTAMAREITATPNLSYVGALPQEAVNELLDRAHLFVNTSTAEGFANTFIQAWMRRVPVLSLSVDPDGLLSSGKFGLYAGGNYDVLREMTDRLICDADLRHRMGRHAAEYALTTHSVANMGRVIQLLLP